MTAPVLPSMSDDAGWADPDTVTALYALAATPLDGAPRTTAELADVYGTADPHVLAASFALADDVATARRLAEQRQVAA